MNFKNSYEESVTFRQIADSLGEGFEYEIFVGTDSHINNKFKTVIYATCIVVWKKGFGGRIFVSKDKGPIPNSLKDRLAKETWKSVETALRLKSFVSAKTEIVIHLDVNRSNKFKSGLYCQELISLVSGQGFKFILKPDAFAAQSVADKFTK